MRWVTEWPTGDHVHILTFAEEGFSTFSHFGDAAGIDRATQRQFVEEIERRQEVGCLPAARLSAMPASAVRGTPDAERVLGFLREARQAVLAGRIRERTIALVLATPRTPRHARRALELFAAETADDGASGVNWIAVLGDGEEAP